VTTSPVGLLRVNLLSFFHLNTNAMSLRPQTIPDVPAETARVAHAVFPHGNIYIQLKVGFTGMNLALSMKISISLICFQHKDNQPNAPRD
jgi:hypothetical protein